MRHVLALTALFLLACAPVAVDVPNQGSTASIPSSESSSVVAAASSSAPVEEVFVRGIYDPERITKKPFGIKIDPATSPVQPERFSGYHTGADFELHPGEDPHTLIVSALCDGKVLLARRVSGYGGVLIQSCFIKAEQLTILYGHLDPTSLKPVGSTIANGEIIGHLGKGFSVETDNERPHLHLSVYKGSAIELKGYVQSEDALGAWLDPVPYLSSQ